MSEDIPRSEGGRFTPVAGLGDRVIGSNPMPQLVPFADLELARRLERTEAVSSARFVEARLRVFPESGATWMETAGVYAMFDGPDSPVTQTFGLGLFAPATPEVLDQLEDFFHSRGAAVNHEVSPLAGIELFRLLVERGYRPVEFTSVMFRTVEDPPEAGREGIQVRPVGESEYDLWAGVSAEGWSGGAPELHGFLLDLGRVIARKENSPCWLAWLNGEPVAAASLTVCGNTAHMAGACTIRRARGRGAQLALLRARLMWAASQECGLAVMGAAPGTGSQRNAERRGFRIAYTRQKWCKV